MDLLADLVDMIEWHGLDSTNTYPTSQQHSNQPTPTSTVKPWRTGTRWDLNFTPKAALIDSQHFGLRAGGCSVPLIP